MTDANGTITMGGKVCLPPTDGDGEALNPPGTVYGACLNGTSPNRIEIDNLRLKQQRLEFASGDTTNEDEDGDPFEDDLLKLYLQGDSQGIRVNNLHVRNDTSDSSTIVRAGHNGGLPLRHSGDHFFLLADMSGIPNTEIRENQMECDDLEVKVFGARPVQSAQGTPGEVLGSVPHRLRVLPGWQHAPGSHSVAERIRADLHPPAGAGRKSTGRCCCCLASPWPAPHR